ncbi:MAG: hypothetical protein HC876_06045 [Chloroflexaceae bacterium]|nr:hypothetical protein [Chloroflexaceae bacterium]
MSYRQSSEGSQRRDHLPAWLRDAPLPAVPPSRQEPAAPDNDALFASFAPSGGYVPPAPDEEQTELPDWLREFANDAEEARASTATGEELPAWLDDMTSGNDTWSRAIQEEHIEEIETPVEDDDDDNQRVMMPRKTTEWLVAMGIESEREKPTEAEIGEITPDDLEDLSWLDVSPDELSRDLAQNTADFDPFTFDPSQPVERADPPTARDKYTEDNALPQWLVPDTNAPTQPGSTSAQESQSSWMPDPAPPPPPQQEANIPSWLHDETSNAQQDDLPAWLMEEAAATPPPPLDEPAAENDIPAWLRDVPDVPKSQADILPSWLMDEPADTPASSPPTSDAPSW